MGGFDIEYYMPVLVMLLIQLIYSGMNLGTRIALMEGMSPSVFIVYRNAFATILLVPVAYLSGRNSASYSLNLRSFSWIFITSLLGTLYQNLYFEGLYLSSASIASAMTNLIPASTFVIAAFIGMEKFNIRSVRTIAKIVGTIICVCGAVFLTLLKGQKLLNAENISSKSIIATISRSTDENNWFLGCLFLLGSNLGWSIWLILQVPAYASHPNYISLSAWMCLMSTLQSSIGTLFLEPDLNAWKLTSLVQLGCTLYAGIMGSAVVFCLQTWCIKKRGPLFSAMFSPLSTVIVTVLASLFLNEEIYIGSLMGAIGVIIGLYIVLWGKAEDVVDVKEKTNPKSVANETEEVAFSINKSCGEASCNIDLEQPLLINVLKTRSEIQPANPSNHGSIGSTN